MSTRNLKNILAMLGYIVTCVCISSTPYMVRWYLALYVIYLIAVWLGHDSEDHE